MSEHQAMAPSLARVARRWQRILAVMRIESLRMLRDPPTLALIVLVPAIQILLFGGAVNLDPKGLRVAISRSAVTSAAPLLQSMQISGYYDVVGDGLPPGEAQRRLTAGRADIALELVVGLAPRLIVDGSDPAAVRPAVLTLEAALLGNASSRLKPQVEWYYNPDARTAWAIAPGLVGVVVMITMLLLGALTLVREREQGTWESLLATPVDGFDALVGKLTPYVLLGLLQAIIVVVAAHWIFDVPVRGSLALLLGACALFAAAHLLLGFALSALAATQIQAVQGAVFFYLPSMLLSGFMFPFAGMPRWARTLGECIPLTHMVRVARGVMLRGAGSELVLAEMWPVALFALLATLVALTAYRRHVN